MRYVATMFTSAAIGNLLFRTKGCIVGFIIGVLISIYMSFYDERFGT